MTRQALTVLLVSLAACTQVPAPETVDVPVPTQTDTGYDELLADLCRRFEPGEPGGRLLDGFIEITPFDPVEVADKQIDWGMDPYHHPSWRFRFHSLSWLRPYLSSDDPEVVARVAEVLVDWLENNPFDDPPSDWSWEDHSTARRAELYVCARPMVDEPFWVAALEEHAKHLADPDFYVDTGNHALDQNIALHKIGCVLDREAWMSLAENRMATLTLMSIDEEGVTNEGAVAYQRYNFQRYGLAIGQLEVCGRVLPAGLDRQRRMPVMLAHATRPDGHYEQIGDTFLTRPLNIRGTVAEYAATGGESGPRPDRRIAVFNAGYVFGRSGWGEYRPFKDENFYSLRFGPSPINRWHRHSDHTSVTWHPHGIPMIIDTGLEGYAPDAYRFRYIKQPESQNVVVLRDGKILNDEGTELKLASVRDGEESFWLAGVPYEGVQRERRLLAVHEPALIVIRDDLVAAESRVFDQLWHFHPDVDVTIEGPNAWIEGPTTQAILVQLQDGQTMNLVAGQTDPYQGWASFSENERTPIPTVIATAEGSEVRFVTLIASAEQVTAEWLDEERIMIEVDGQHLIVDVTDPMRTVD